MNVASPMKNNILILFVLYLYGFLCAYIEEKNYKIWQQILYTEGGTDETVGHY